MQMKVYLDNSATTKPYDQVVEIMAETQRTNWGNPSSAHSMGLDAEKIIKESADIIAGTFNVNKENIIFTSGGTESNNTALMQPFSNINKINDAHIVISAIEHPAVNGPSDYLEGNGAKLDRVPVDELGLVDLDRLESTIRHETAIISVMAVNNEVGTIQPIKEICKIKASAMSKGSRDLLLHTDAVQAYGKYVMDLSSSDLSSIDMLTVSAHKIHGPKGVGVLFVRNPSKVKPFIRGGGQQRGFRSGTENVAAIAGFGSAALITENNMEDNIKKVGRLREKLLFGLKSEIDNIRINSPEEISFTGEPGKSVPSILSVSFPGTKGEVILHSLEQNGIFVSTESACASKKKGRSPVLTAMGLDDEEIEGTIRFSFSAFNTEDEIEYVVKETKSAVDKFRKLTGYRRR